MGTRTSRRTFLGTLGLVSVATLLAACGGPAPGSVAPAAAPQAAPTAAPAAPGRSRFDNVASFYEPVPATFRVQLKRADCPFLSITMQTPIVPRHVLAGSADINADEFNSSRPVGTGPFTLKEWRRGEYTRMLANPTHWQARPKIDQWIRTTVTDRNVLLAKLKLGEVDYAPVPPDTFDELQAEPNLNVVPVQSPVIITYIAFNTRWQTPGKREFDAIVAGGGAGVTIDPDQSNLWLSSEYPNGGNFVHYSNPTVDQVLQQARGISGCDPAARKPLYEQFQQLLAEDQPFTFLYSANTIAAINKRLQNVTPSPWAGSSPYVTWGIKDWTVSS